MKQCFIDKIEKKYPTVEEDTIFLRSTKITDNTVAKYRKLAVSTKAQSQWKRATRRFVNGRPLLYIAHKLDEKLAMPVRDDTWTGGL